MSARKSSPLETNSRTSSRKLVRYFCIGKCHPAERTYDVWCYDYLPLYEIHLHNWSFWRSNITRQSIKDFRIYRGLSAKNSNLIFNIAFYSKCWCQHYYFAIFDLIIIKYYLIYNWIKKCKILILLSTFTIKVSFYSIL